MLQQTRSIERPRDDIRGDVGLVREVDTSLGQGHRLNQPQSPVLGTIAKETLELPHGLPPLRLGIGVDQVGQSLDRGQVELAVVEGAPGEFTGFGRSQPRQPRQRRKGGSDHRPAPVQLKLDHVLAGLGIRALEEQHQRLVDGVTRSRIAHRGQHGAPRFGHAADQRLQRGAGLRTGDPDHADRSRYRTGGQRVDGVGDSNHVSASTRFEHEQKASICLALVADVYYSRPMKSVTLRLPDDLVDEIEAEARKRKMSKTDIMRERLSKPQPPNSPKEWSDILASVAGSVDGLPPDLSSNVKKYLKSTGYGRNRSR